MIGAGVLLTTALSTAITGSASNEATDVPVARALTQDVSPITAQASETSAEQQTLEKQLVAPQPPADSLLMAVLSLESSTTSAEVQASMQRILELGLPQETPPSTLLLAVDEADDAADEDETTEDADSDQDPRCRDTGSDAYCIYTVVEGDSLSRIAQEFGFEGNDEISAAEMLAQSNKPDVVSSDHIEPGQNIRVPRETGILHTVLFSETASDIASDYGVSVDDLTGSSYNAIGGDGVVLIGQEVFIPNPTRLPVNQEVELTLELPTPEPTPEDTVEPTTEPTQAPTATPEPTEEGIEVPDVPQLGPLDTPTPTPEPTEESTQTPESEEDAEPTPTEPPSVAPPGSVFIWPASGPISSYFSASHPLGIDIDLFDNPSAPIVAARGGTVVFAGGDPCCSYGLYVIIDHGNGLQTLYAHLSEVLVSEGEEVDQGDLVGLGGRTGYATGNHLHFEIRIDGNVIDPLKYLP